MRLLVGSMLRRPQRITQRLTRTDGSLNDNIARNGIKRLVFKQVWKTSSKVGVYGSGKKGASADDGRH